MRKAELQQAAERSEDVLKQARVEARRALEEAGKINNCDLTKGIPTEMKSKFATLPEKIPELESMLHEAEAAAQCSGHDVDEQVVRDFERRKKTIEKLEAQVVKAEANLNNHQGDYESMKNEWTEQVETMISGINEKFSALFKQLKCSGEVSLARPDNLEEFSKYGICIRVCFRSDEQLQELTAWQQSGGEKSVSTMMYMIALQEMTKCPFRVVDEINQGMDPVNERKVFDIIVQNSCAKQFAQYFLLTPKLLPDLCFDAKTNVVCVYNGLYNLTHSKYDLRRFIEIKKKLDSSTSS